MLEWPELTPEFLKYQAGRPARDAARYLLGDFLYARVGETFAQIKDDIAETRAPEAELYPGVADSLVELRGKGMLLGIFTSATKSRCDKMLNRQEILKNQMNTVLYREAYANGKPAPDGLVRAGEILQVAPAQMVFVGDAEADYLSAKACGCPFILFSPDEDNRKYGLQARTHADIPGLIAQSFPDSKAVVYDLDGTLVDSNALHDASWIEAYAQVRRMFGMQGP
jgi:HAD superfamily hydrolase (TIGR01509 family)